jgi:gas vesicle protein
MEQRESKFIGKEEMGMSDRVGFVAGLMMGTLVGVGLGILLAPRAGQETREQLKGKAQVVGELLKTTAAEMGGRMHENAAEIASKMKQTIDQDDLLNRLGRNG